VHRGVEERTDFAKEFPRTNVISFGDTPRAGNGG
jgi:hypothetical protein